MITIPTLNIGFLPTVSRLGMWAYALENFTTRIQFEEWGWRISFMVGALMGALGFYLRRRLNETEVFTRMIEEKKLVGNPFKMALKTQKWLMFLGFIRMSYRRVESDIFRSS